MKLSNLTNKYKIKDYKFTLVISVLALSCIGILVIGSARSSLQNRQVAGLIFSLGVMVVVSLFDYIWILNMYWLIYAGNLILLLAVYFFGSSKNAAQRWIDIGFTEIQPSELTKILMILFFAKFIMLHEDSLSEIKTIIKAGGLLLPSVFLILSQPDLSTTISICLVFCVLMYVGGLSYRFIVTVILILIPTAIIFISLAVQPNPPFLKPYQQERILAWLEPEKYASDTAFQQNNSVMAIGSGQLTGKGLNNNTTTSLKNGNYILEPQTDFIFAIIGEELGFVGCCIIIGLLLLIVIQCILIGARAPDLAGRIICCGVAAQIAFQGFINIAVATQILPNTGLPLPFVSSGLTSLVSLYVGIGLVLNVGLQPKKYQ